MCITEESYHSGGLQKEKEKLFELLFLSSGKTIIRQNYRQAKLSSGKAGILNSNILYYIRNKSGVSLQDRTSLV